MRLRRDPKHTIPGHNFRIRLKDLIWQSARFIHCFNGVPISKRSNLLLVNQKELWIDCTKSADREKFIASERAVNSNAECAGRVNKNRNRSKLTDP